MNAKYQVTQDIPQSIFRAYDIRGIAGEQLSENAVFTIGLAIGSEAKQHGETQIAVARDGRLSGPALSQALIAGLCASGIDVIDIGMAPTAVLYYATNILPTKSGVMLTGSHNPAEYNGLKIVIDGETLAEQHITALAERISKQDFTQGQGSVTQQELLPKYIERISSDVTLSKPLKIVVDCGNGIAGIVAPQLFRELGCEVIELFCDIDGNFPNHHPDPSIEENLVDLQRAVKQHQADLGLAFDGDADRLGMVTESGDIIWPDRQMIAFAQDVLRAEPGAKIVFDVKCTRHLPLNIQQHGGVPLMAKTGHSLIKAKLKQENAALAGEMSGHIFFKQRWYGFDDGVYAAARMLEIVGQHNGSAGDLFAAIPDSINTPELKINIDEANKFSFMQRLTNTAQFDGAEINTLDGMRVEYTDSWGLIRPSNTTPCLVLRFEADSKAALERIKAEFRAAIHAVDDSLHLPF